MTGPSDAERLAALQRRLEQTSPADPCYPIVEAHRDYLAGEEARAVAAFAAQLERAKRELVADRPCLNHVMEAGFWMRQFDALEELLRFAHGGRVRIVVGRSEWPDECTIVRWTLGADGTSTFGFPEGIESHVFVDVLLKHWVQELPLLVDFARRNDAGAGAVWLSLADPGTVPGLTYGDFRDGFYLLPDPIFMQTRGYAEVKATYAAQAVPWEARAPIAFWRGSTTGWYDVAGRKIRGWRDLPRVELCRLAQPEAARGLLDAGLSGIVQIEDEQDREAIRQAGLLKGNVSWSEFQKYKYQIDIDGNTNSWPGMFMKLCTGSPTLKVQSSMGFRQWYYERLVAWENYVPVAADMSDLLEKIAWLQAHDEAARRIGANALDLALSMSEASEIARAAPTIRQALSAAAD